LLPRRVSRDLALLKWSFWHAGAYGNKWMIGFSKELDHLLEAGRLVFVMRSPYLSIGWKLPLLIHYQLGSPLCRSLLFYFLFCKYASVKFSLWGFNKGSCGGLPCSQRLKKNTKVTPHPKLLQSPLIY
jgi:hypothetical protein